MFKWIGKKTGSGAVDGAIARLGQKLASIDFEKFNLVSRYLTPEQANEFHRNIALLISYGVAIAAKKAAEKASEKSV